jgi:hypothetical protein
MSRLMSVAFTEDQVVARQKTVTRRKGWWKDKNGRRLLVAGDHLTLCHKVMGRAPGEPLVRICEVEVVDVRRERLDALMAPVAVVHDDEWMDYGPSELIREGFRDMGVFDFILEYFVRAQGMTPSDEITRIEWRYLDDEAGAA